MWTPHNFQRFFSVRECIRLYCLKFTKFGQLNLGKVIKIVDTRFQG